MVWLLYLRDALLALGAASMCHRLLFALRSHTPRPTIDVLGHEVVVPQDVSIELIRWFRPLVEWCEKARRFFDGETRSLCAVAIESVQLSSKELVGVTLRCRAKLDDKTECFSLTLRYPMVVLLLWCEDDDTTRLLMVKEEQVGLLRSRFVLPHGRNVNGEYRGACLQQLKIETGLTVADARRVEDATLEIDPKASNETYEIYSAKVPNLADLLDEDDESGLSLVPLEDAALGSDARAVQCLLRARSVFPRSDDGYVTP